MLRKIISNSLIYSLGPQIPKVAGLLILPLITPYLTTNDYGIQGLVTAYVGILGALADLGLAVVMVNTFYAYPNRWPIVWKQLHGVLIGWSLVFALIQALIVIFILPPEADQNKWLITFLVCSPVLLFNTTILIGSRYYQYSQKPLFVSISNAVVGTITLVVNYVTIVHFKLGYLGWFISSFVSSFVLFLFYVYPVYFKLDLGPVFSFRRRFLNRHLKVSLPTIPHDYSAYLVNTSDRAVFGLLDIKLSAQGLYNVGYMFGNYFEFFGTSVGMAIGPFYTKLYSEKNSRGYWQARNLTFLMQAGFIALAVVVCIWSKEIMSLLIRNKDLQTAYPLAIIIIMGYVYRPMYWATGIRLSVLEKTHQLWRISFVAGVMNLLLNFIFVPIFGVTAAAVTTFFALLYMGFAGFLVSRDLRSMVNDFHPLVWLLIILVCSFGAYMGRDLSLVWKVMVTVLISMVMAMVFIKYNRDEWIFREIKDDKNGIQH